MTDIRAGKQMATVGPVPDWAALPLDRYPDEPVLPAIQAGFYDLGRCPVRVVGNDNVLTKQGLLALHTDHILSKAHGQPIGGGRKLEAV
jgi:hypothetical protein